LTPVSSEDDRRRRLRAAPLSGLVFPGAGQIYLGARARGAALVFATLLALGMLLVRLFDVVLARVPETPVLDPVEAWRLSWSIMEETRGELTSLTLLIVGIWAVSVLDAWLGSGRSGR
jgi:hypothetical protein